jgi:hypothetical protein
MAPGRHFYSQIVRLVAGRCFNDFKTLLLQSEYEQIADLSIRQHQQDSVGRVLRNRTS